MAESDLSGARARIVVVERRLAALQDLGLDVAALRTQLGQARAHIDEGASDEAQILCDEVAEAARRLASGASRSSGDWRGLPKAQLLDELRRVLGEGAAGELMAERERALRDELDAKQREFERRLRDQFAREMAQVMSARPWMKDLPIAAVPAEEIAALRQELEALRAAPATSPDHVRQLIAEAQLSQAASPGSGPSMGLITELKREIETLRGAVRGVPGTAQINAMVTRAVEARTPASPGNPSDDELRRLVAESAALQARLGDRLLGLESRIVSVIDPQHRVSTAMAPPTGLAPEVKPATEGGWPFPGEDSSRRSSEPASLKGSALARAQSAPTTPVSAVSPLAPRSADDSDDSSRAGAVPSLAMPMQEPLTAAISVAIRPASNVTPATPGSGSGGMNEAVVRRLIDERLAGQKRTAGEEVTLDDDELTRQLIRLMPGVMRDPVVRSALFAGFALEATAHPGALAELSGLRTFLRKELQMALDGLRRELGVGVG